jgi:GAF domain-containing protein
VPADHVFEILSRLSVDAEPELVATRLCELCAEATGMSGAALMMVSLDRPQVSIGTTNSVSELIEELQYTLGEGPCLDAYEQRAPVLEPDLAEPLVARWTAFSPVAVSAGVRAIFGFPLSVGDLPIGALNLYRDRPGGLSASQHADALLLASVAARAIISIEADAPPGSLNAELQVGTNFRFVVHQAAGMVSVQLGVSVADALVRLRAHAFAIGRSILDLSEDVVERRFRFADRGVVQ